MTSFCRSPTTTKKLRFFSCAPLRMRAGIRESLTGQSGSKSVADSDTYMAFFTMIADVDVDGCDCDASLRRGDGVGDCDFSLLDVRVATFFFERDFSAPRDGRFTQLVGDKIKRQTTAVAGRGRPGFFLLEGSRSQGPSPAVRVASPEHTYMYIYIAVS